ncbi:MAG: hypothetical protein Rhob2KO_44900 [Rhodopirellula baltica]
MVKYYSTAMITAIPFTPVNENKMGHHGILVTRQTEVIEVVDRSRRPRDPNRSLTKKRRV